MTHRPGSQNQLADGLSRLPSPDNITTIDLDLRVDLVRFSTERLDKVRSDTSLDAVLNQLVETIIAGWPEDVKDLPPDIRSFWSCRDQLSVENGFGLERSATRYSTNATARDLATTTYCSSRHIEDNASGKRHSVLVEL